MKLIVGIDEVGRGPVAGPVAVCAFVMQAQAAAREARRRTIPPLRDSKKLSKSQREAWFAEIKQWQKEGKCDFAVSMISAKQIDKIGIAPAIRLALTRSLKKLEKQNYIKISDSRIWYIFLDGGLKAPAEYKNQKTIIKGDEKIPVISLASICAKVIRDRLMSRLAKKYPNYGFERHVGYGTRAHYGALKKHGLTAIHRRSFLKGFATKA